jgi:hypothetical protein
MELHWAIWVGIIIGGIILFFTGRNILSSYMSNKKKRVEHLNLWKRNVSPDVKPGPLMISYDAYSRATKLFKEGNSIANSYHLRGLDFVAKMGFIQNYSDFCPRELVTRWMIAYDLQAKEDNYPPNLHFSEEFGTKITSADLTRTQERMETLINIITDINIYPPDRLDEMANKLNMGFKAPAEQFLGIIALYLLDNSYHLGEFRDELENHLIASQGDHYVISFIREMYHVSELVEVTTERLVKENKVNS